MRYLIIALLVGCNQIQSPQSVSRETNQYDACYMKRGGNGMSCDTRHMTTLEGDRFISCFGYAVDGPSILIDNSNVTKVEDYLARFFKVEISTILEAPTDADIRIVMPQNIECLVDGEGPFNCGTHVRSLFVNDAIFEKFISDIASCN